MGEFLRKGDVIEPKLVFTLPVEKRPGEMMYHSIVIPEENDTYAVCVVHPNGSVMMFPRASRADVRRVLVRDYQVGYEDLQGISWD